MGQATQVEYVSTRGVNSCDFITAVKQGLAPDGGLYVPTIIPDQTNLLQESLTDYQSFTKKYLSQFIGRALKESMDSIINSAFNFPLEHIHLDNHLSLLELFHGPTLSFKDFGARFLAQVLTRESGSRLILVATSGDTGSAVASSFDGLDNIRCCVLFPKDKISKRQEAQITCWGKNILAVEVDGNFDDCQSLVKQAFHYPEQLSEFQLSTANSINIGRLLPQMSYYAYTATKHYQVTGKEINFVVPSGNLGNVTACIYAKSSGMPIDKIIIACNANEAVLHYYHTGQYVAADTIQTIANAMDVGAPSNFERLVHFYETHQAFCRDLTVVSVSDKQIQQAIIECKNHYNYVLCPHTATAYFARQKLKLNAACLVATAHPAKFEQVIEPIIKTKLAIPSNLQRLLDRQQTKRTIKADLAALVDVLQS
jgi:threonine synthase